MVFSLQTPIPSVYMCECVSVCKAWPVSLIGQHLALTLLSFSSSHQCVTEDNPLSHFWQVLFLGDIHVCVCTTPSLWLCSASDLFLPARHSLSVCVCVCLCVCVCVYHCELVVVFGLYVCVRS